MVVCNNGAGFLQTLKSNTKKVFLQGYGKERERFNSLTEPQGAIKKTEPQGIIKKWKQRMPNSLKITETMDF